MLLLYAINIRALYKHYIQDAICAFVYLICIYGEIFLLSTCAAAVSSPLIERQKSVMVEEYCYTEIGLKKIWVILFGWQE